MRIKTQFIVTMLLFGIILVVIAALAVITDERVEKAGGQERIAVGIAKGAGELSYLANDYLIYRESQQLSRWQSRFSSFSRQVEDLKVGRPEQQALVLAIRANERRLKEVFDSVISSAADASSNPKAALDSAFLQVSWSRMAVQSQGLISDASRLSQSLHLEIERLRATSIRLVYGMLCFLGVLLLTGYLLAYRRILRSIARLQKGAAVIGSGNLDFRIEERGNDEIGDLSRAFNRMTADLNSVTASKADLENQIAERRRAEEALRESREDLARAQEVGQIGSWRLDVRRNVLTWSDENHRIFGVPKGTPLTYESFLDIVHPDDRAYVDTRWKKGLCGEPYDIEHRIVVGSQVKWVREKAYLEFDEMGKLLGGFGITQDITERRQAEEALQEAHAELQDRARRLEETNRELESFAYTISHDLRSPLRAINGFARLLADDHGRSLDEEAKRLLRVIEANAVRMGLLIDDLLAFSRAGRTSMNLSRIDMSRLAADVVETLKTSDDGDGDRIQVAALPPALGDRTLIRQVIANLIENAVKFSGKSDNPRVEVGSMEIDGEQVYFVKDNGVGFDMKYRDKLFGVFHRLVADKEFEGTGVGLAIVQRIVTRHGGRVWAEAAPGEGATFFFTLKQRS